MPPTVYIAWRFITSRKRAMGMTLCGIVFGVGFFILTQAQTSGFQVFFIQTILGTKGAIRIEDRFQDTMQSAAAKGVEGEPASFRVRSDITGQYVEGVEYPEKIRNALLSYQEVTGVSEIMPGSGSATTGFREQSVRLFGIRIEDHIRVSDLAQQITFGSLETFVHEPRTVIIGQKLSERLDARVGDYITIQTSKGSGRFRVAAIFESGVSDIDRQYIYMHLGETRSLLRNPHSGAILQIGLIDPDKAPELAEQMRQHLFHYAASWQKREKVWLDVFKALRLSSAITVSTIILLSGLGMFNTLAMMVMEKNREIAILRSMGYSQKDILEIFIWQGIFVLCGGVLLGWAVGALATWGISSIPLRIRGIFSTDRFVVSWDWTHYAAAAMVAIVVVLIASYIPARRAARLEPGAVIRGSAA